MPAGQRSDRTALEDVEVRTIERPFDIPRATGAGVQVAHRICQPQNIGFLEDRRLRHNRRCLNQHTTAVNDVAVRSHPAKHHGIPQAARCLDDHAQLA